MMHEPENRMEPAHNVFEREGREICGSKIT